MPLSLWKNITVLLTTVKIIEVRFYQLAVEQLLNSWLLLALRRTPLPFPLLEESIQERENRDQDVCMAGHSIDMVACFNASSFFLSFSRSQRPHNTLPSMRKMKTMQCQSKTNDAFCLDKQHMHFKTLAPLFPSLDDSVVRSRNSIVKHTITLKPRKQAAPKTPQPRAALYFPSNGFIQISNIKSEVTRIEPVVNKCFSFITPKYSSKQFGLSHQTVIKVPDLTKPCDVTNSHSLLRPRLTKVTYDSNDIPKTPHPFDQENNLPSGYVYETPKMNE